jgi:hypothetical protein
MAQRVAASATDDLVVSHTSNIFLRQWLQQATSVIAAVAAVPGSACRGSKRAANPL